MANRFCRTPGMTIGILLLATLAAGQEGASRPTYQVRATADDVRIDGSLEEAVWQEPPTFTLNYETSPGDNIPARVRTEMWITYNSSHLYIAARAADPKPQEIRAQLSDRDKAFQDDFLGVALDTFNDERRAFEFFVNPFGVQMDSTMSDVTGTEDDSWDAIWDSAGKLTATGYDVEIAIPFSSLRFPKSTDVQTWGIDAVRIYPRDQRYRFGLSPRPRGSNCYLCNEAKLTGFQGIRPGRNIEFDPTLTGNRTESRGDPEADFNSDQDLEPGITGRWGITPGITINGAVNPDFSQVEADAAELTVNKQFAIFYPEKRPFFLEGADIFETKINAVYTRDIADPSWGLKISGKEGKSAFGVILAQDEQTNLLFPSNQFSDLGTLDQENISGILRYRYDVGAESSMGAILTARSGDDYSNYVVGMDTLLRRGPHASRIEFLGSSTRYPASVQMEFDQPAGKLKSTALRAAYQYTLKTWMGYALYQGAGDDFRADLGFIPQVGYHKGFGILERYWYFDESGQWWRKFTAGVESTWTYDRQGNPLQQQVAPYVLLNGAREFSGFFYAGLGPSYYQDRRFDRNFFYTDMEMRPYGPFFFEFEGFFGQEIDYDNARQGRTVRLEPEVRFDVARHLRLEIANAFETFHVEEGELYRANVLELRATYQFTNRTFVRVITQLFDVAADPELYTFPVPEKDQALFNQFLFSYKINPQVVLFLGYSDNYSNGASYGLAQKNRTLFFKIGYAFVL